MTLEEFQKVFGPTRGVSDAEIDAIEAKASHSIAFIAGIVAHYFEILRVAKKLQPPSGS